MLKGEGLHSELWTPDRFESTLSQNEKGKTKKCNKSPNLAMEALLGLASAGEGFFV